MASGQSNESFVDFERFHSALQDVDLFSCKGSILRVSGLTAESNGPEVGLGQLCQIHLRDGRKVPAEVVAFKVGHLILLPLEHIDGISPGDTVTTLDRPRYITLDESILGRVIDGLGRPIDGKGPLRGCEKRPLDNSSPPALSRKMITEPLSLGIRSIDGLLTPIRFWLPSRPAASDPQKSRCSLPGESDWAKLPTTMS